MRESIVHPPYIENEPVRPYSPGEATTLSLKKKLEELSSQTVDIPCIINGQPVFTQDIREVRCPHNHQKVIARYHHPSQEHVDAALEGCREAYSFWSEMPAGDRAAIFLKAADLITHKHRDLMNASTMLGQSKTCHQAEIDASCELIDFLKFNVEFQNQLHQIQPRSGEGQWNHLEYRPLEGFVFAVAPFNFTSISINLPCSAALMGNVALWKPSPTSALACHYGMQILMEAGLPPGVIQFLPAEGSEIGPYVMEQPDLAGIHFTGSTQTFQLMWETVGKNIKKYHSYPRIVGETGGKDFIFAHESCSEEVLKTAILRGAFEFQGQKCSAASRAYIPRPLWEKVKKSLAQDINAMTMGDVSDFSHFMGAVIDERSFDKITGYIERAKASGDCEIVAGGEYDKSVGYFVRPTLIETTNPHYESMVEEIFGPVITVYAYNPNDFEQTLRLCDTTSNYALTGCILSQDRAATILASKMLRHSAGNFYINNKPTGAVVNQQPFGGGRASGTNDKAGSMYNLMRWVSLRTISETFNAPTDYRYPFLEKKK